MGRRRRRRHSAEFKAAVIAECMRPGVSVAAVALGHSLNANMLRKWVIDAEQAGTRTPPAVAAPEPVRLPAPGFVPLAPMGHRGRARRPPRSRGCPGVWWRLDPAQPPAAFVPLSLAPPLPAAAAAPADICIEFRRGEMAITVTWPSAAAAERAHWMRELLRWFASTVWLVYRPAAGLRSSVPSRCRLPWRRHDAGLLPAAAGAALAFA